MSDVTRILGEIEHGDSSAAEHLLPLVYDELRKLATARLAREKPGQTLQATALVHDAYLRLVDVEQTQHWNSRGHFFAAAAEAMRRILVENARKKKQLKRGGDRHRVDLDPHLVVGDAHDHTLLEIDEALSALKSQDATAAHIFEMRYFAGCSVEDAAEHLGISRATAYRHWTFVRAWIKSQMSPCE